MNVLDPHLRLRLAEWLAYHLSNFGYMWIWDKWGHVLAAPAYDGQRRFCVAVLNRLVRLSYWDRIQSVMPEDFRILMPPKPEVRGWGGGVQGGGRGRGGLAPAGGRSARAASCSPTACPACARPGQVVPLPDPADADVAESDPVGHWAARMYAEVRGKATPQQLDAWKTEQVRARGEGGAGLQGCEARSCAAMRNGVRAPRPSLLPAHRPAPSLPPSSPQDVEALLGGALGMVRCWARCLLVAGAKSYTHMVIALERYYGPLKNAVDAAGLEVGSGPGWR